jgi:hypothetical protein
MKHKGCCILFLGTLFFACSLFAHAEKFVYVPDLSNDFCYISQSSSAKAAIGYTKSHMYGVTEVCACTHENVMKHIVFRHILPTKNLLDSCVIRTSRVSYDPSETGTILSNRDSNDYFIYSIRHIII